MRHPIASLLASAVLAAAPAAFALPTEVGHENLDNCDLLSVPADVHELGEVPAFEPFPNERIRAATTFIDQFACPMPGNELPNTIVSITNDTGIAWSDLWYVGDTGTAGAGAGTTFTNFDGLVNGGLAFKIDTLGVNRPLFNENLLADGIFAPGETWLFIIDGYANSFGLPADAIDSIGVGSLSVGLPSSGSIIAIRAVPEPALLALLAIPGALALRRRNDG